MTTPTNPNTKHTPRWKAIDLRHQKNGQIQICDRDEPFLHVANVLASHPYCAEQAALIVKAVNCHAVLVDALITIRDSQWGEGESYPDRLRDLQHQARAALKQAEGE
jgi:hypothetical protein